jgi:hypothetical protein
MAEKQAVFKLKVDTGNSVQDLQNFDQAVNKLNTSLDDSSQSIDKNATFAQRYGDELQPLTTRLGEAEDRLYELALAGQQASDEYKELLKTVSNYRKTQIAVDAVVDASAQTMGMKLVSAVELGAGAFQGVQSAIALTGTESEALTQTMVKLQAAQGLVNAVQTVSAKLQSNAIIQTQVRSALQKAQNFILYGSAAAVTAESTATKAAAGAKVAMTAATTGTNLALKLFRGALIATGIGALIVGLGLLIANFDKVVKFMQPVIDGFKAIGDAIGLSDFAGEERAAKENARHEREIKQLERMKAARDLAFNNEQKALDRLIAVRSAEGKSVEALTKQKIQGSIAYQKELQKELQANLNALEVNILQFDQSTKSGRFFANVLQEKIDIVKVKNEEAKNSILDSENELKVIDITAKEGAKDRRKTDADDARKLRRSIEDEEIKAIKDKDQREQTQLIVSAQRRIEDLSLTEKDAKKNAQLIKQIEQNLITDLDKLDQEWYNQQQQAQKVADGFRIQQERELLQMIEDISEQNFQLTLSDQERELLAIQDKYFTIETLAAGNSEALREIEIAKLNEFNNVNLKFQEERDRQNKEQAEKEKKREQDILEFKLNSVTETFKLISTITEMFGKKGENAARRAFMIQKASSIAQATIETYKGANAIFASAAANPSSILFPAQPFIAAGLAVAAGVANIAKIASQKFEGGGAPSTSSDTGSIPSLTGASASSFTANTNTQTTDLTTLGQGSQQGTSMSQVVVLESDITGTQNKVRLQEAKTSF